MGSAEASTAIGFKAEVRGYLAHSTDRVYVVVKPLNDRSWYIQPPAPAVFIGTGATTDWAGQAFLGTINAGIGEQFVVLAIVTSDRHVAEEKLANEPAGLKSNAVLLKRSR